MKAWLLICLVVFGCTPKPDLSKSIDVQGHRGARGLAPENTIPAFIKAVELGVTTLELDLVVSKDSLLVISHEPYLSPVICLDTLGNMFPYDSIINIFHLKYEDIKKFDCGITKNPRFPNQQLISAAKPLLTELIDSIQSIFGESHQIRYNIELKTKKETDAVFHPTPETFSDIVYETLHDKGLLKDVTIQSFDFRTLQYFNRRYPEVDLVLLIENELSWQSNIDSLGFKPATYSPYYQLLSQQIISDIQEKGIKVVPWTVNEIADMEQLISWGVDGIITDYPDRALNVTKKK